LSDDPPTAHRIVWGLLGVFLLGFVGFAIYSRMASNSTPPPPVYSTAGNFSFQDQRGKTVTAADFNGHPWIADFIFTRCAGTCNVMTAALSAVNKLIPESSDVKLVSFSMDPEYDTSKVLAEYAKAQGADHPRWYFLTGNRDEMFRLTRDNFKQVVTLEGGTPDEPIVHSTRFVLVDRHGRIRGFYAGQEKESVDKLLADLKKVEKER
jgi:protein SCO1